MRFLQLNIGNMHIFIFGIFCPANIGEDKFRRKSKKDRLRETHAVGVV